HCPSNTSLCTSLCTSRSCLFPEQRQTTRLVVAIHSIALAEAERTQKILLLKVNVRQRLTVWSTVDGVVNG
ncbi:hypothetical protein LSAT2_023946, partial [Lamellibrachia satsuma]